MEIKTETMRYNHITDSVYANITRGIDRYSLCVIPIYLYPRVNIGCIILFTDKWKDSGITGVLCLVTCRKLKSNVIRIYDGDVTMSSRNNHM